METNAYTELNETARIFYIHSTVGKGRRKNE